MSYIERNNYNLSLQLHGSIIASTINGEREFIIKLNDLKLHKYLGSTELSRETNYVDADLVLINIIMHGEEPVYPSRILDFSLVKDGRIFGNLIDYPFIIRGKIQFVITFESYEKLTISAEKMFISITDSVLNDQQLQ